MHRPHALAVRRLVGLLRLRGRLLEGMLVMRVRGWVMLVWMAWRIPRPSVIMWRCIWWIFLMPRWVHGRVVRSACRLETRPGPVPRVWRATVLLLCCALVYRTWIFLWVSPVTTRRVCAAHAHLPTLSFAKFSLTELPLAEFAFTKLYFTILSLPLLPLSVRQIPLVFVFYSPNGALGVVLFRNSHFFPVSKYLWRRPR